MKSSTQFSSSEQHQLWLGEGGVNSPADGGVMVSLREGGGVGHVSQQLREVVSTTSRGLQAPAGLDPLEALRMEVLIKSSCPPSSMCQVTAAAF